MRDYGDIRRETAAEHRARVDRIIAANQREAEDKVLRRLAATPEGRLRLANALDEGRECARAARREAFPLVA